MRRPVVTRFSLFLGSLLAIACSSSEGVEEGRTRLVIDTDLPTPEVASRLRVDLFREDGTWFASRELDTSRPGAFPASFDVAAPASGEARVRVRLRLFPDAYTRSYRGERFADWPAVLGEPAAGEVEAGPRLLVDGQDQTPAQEPSPSVTVDRLVDVVARAGERREVGAVLRGVCAGTMADLAGGTTCVATERQREAVSEPTDAVSTLSQTDSQREPCDGVDPGDGRVCVPGGVFVLGDRSQAYLPDPDGFLLDSRTERVVRVRRFVMDREEVSVGRYRALVAAGLKTSHYQPRENDGPLSDDPTAATSCTFTNKASDRENHPLNCLPWVTFREVCQRDGGELPTEAQWEYAAALAGSSTRRRYAWGDDTPTCDRAVYARVGSKEEKYCPASPALVALDDPANDGDRTPLGLHAMAGSLGEFVLDRTAAYTGSPWAEASFDHPALEPPMGPSAKVGDDDRFVLRGGSWVSPSNILNVSSRASVSAASPFYGARCVYPAP